MWQRFVVGSQLIFESYLFTYHGHCVILAADDLDLSLLPADISQFFQDLTHSQPFAIHAFNGNDTVSFFQTCQLRINGCILVSAEVGQKATWAPLDILFIAYIFDASCS